MEDQSNAELGLSAWAVIAFGRVQKLIVRADVADEEACKQREMDPEATAVPLYSWAAIEAAVAAERERCAVLCGSTPQADDMHCCAHMAATLAAKIRA